MDPRRRPGAWLGLLVALGLSGLGGRPLRADQGPSDQGAGSFTYALADTYTKAPWQARAGRYGHAGDISSCPDGRTYLLDGRLGAAHALAADGSPRQLIGLARQAQGGLWTPTRLDCGPDGRLHVLSRSPGIPGGPASRIEILDEEGRSLAAFTRAQGYEDIAVGPESRIFLTASGSPARTEVFDSAGLRQATFGLGALAGPTSIDVAADGTVYIVDRVPLSGVGPGPGPGPGPSPTPLPSLRRGPQGGGASGKRAGARAAPAQASATRPAVSPSPPASPAPDPTATGAFREGVAIFGADLELRERLEFTGVEDVAVGPAGVFLSRDLEVFALGERDPVLALPHPVALPGAEASIALHLDAPFAGGLRASLRHCYAQGMLEIPRPSDRPAAWQLSGEIDAPSLEGPVYPWRVAAGGELGLLQGRFAVTGDRPDQRYHPAPLALEAEPQSVQRWTAGGSLRSQLGVCAGHSQARGAWWARDLALDGATVYTVDSAFLHQRAGPHFPSWSYFPAQLAAPGEAARLEAVDADGHRVAALDLGLGRVIVLGADGRLQAQWPFASAAAPLGPLPIDLALAGDRVWLVQAGRAQLLGFDLEGRLSASWPTHENPKRIAAGPDGAVLVLGHSGRAYHYAPEGRLLASWAMPESAPEPLDVAVGDDGRVFVSYLRQELDLMPRGSWATVLSDAGVWVFEPKPAPERAPPPTGACLAWPDKTAAPERLSLGDRVDVELRVEGGCPDRPSPLQLAIVFDASRSMGWNDALPRAQDALLDLLGRLDPEATELAFVRFADRAVIAAPLGRDPAAIARLVAAQAPEGDTRLGEGIALAHEALLAGLRPGARQAILIVGDGGFKDMPQAAAGSALADGIEIYALIVRSPDFPGIRAVAALTGDRGDRVLLDPDRSAMADLAARLTAPRRTNGLFETVTVRDRVPANMRYIEGSANPPAAWEPGTRTLIWQLGPVGADEGLRLRYQVQPLAVGHWPTNDSAEADYRDALGRDGRIGFPVPRVTVLGPVPQRVFLPFALRAACLDGAQGLDIVLVIDSSQSMDEPAAGGETKLDAARRAARGFLDRLDPGRDRAAIVSFDAEARPASRLVADPVRWSESLAGIRTAPGTRIDLGLGAAWGLLVGDGRAQAQAVVILLTDGRQDAGAPAGAVEQHAQGLRALSALVYAIGLGEGIDRDLLRRVAGRSEGYLESPTPADLDRAYAELRERLACEAPGGVRKHAKADKPYLAIPTKR